METLATRKAERGCESQLSPEQLVASIADIARAGVEVNRQRHQPEQVVFRLPSTVATLDVEIEPIKHEEK